jgi:penicillin-binding protein 1A
MTDSKKINPDVFPETTKKKLYRVFWLLAMSPFIFILFFILFQSEDELPPTAFLDNPPELLASIVYADDGQTELGRYFKINRKSVPYKDITPFLTDALISTEDERFYEHSGVDAKAIGRAIVNVGGAGGASTISQQLAKQLFTLQARDREALAKAQGVKVSEPGRIGRKWRRLGEKARENIIATRLERKYTKEDIIAMYFNQFDFLYNAVGIHSAAKVYYNKTPKDLSKIEAAMLVGMCKNPSLFNPYTFSVKNYRVSIAARKGVSPKEITKLEIAEARAKDSTMAADRRNQVLFQWFKNSTAGNEALRVKITKEEYDQLKVMPVKTNYQIVDHKTGEAPYFREQLRGEISKLLTTKKENGELAYKREDGMAWDVYSDGLRIYTTINYEMQKHAETALKDHLRNTLQQSFDNNNASCRNKPFSNDLSDSAVEAIKVTAMKRSDRWRNMSLNGSTPEQITSFFNNKKVDMVVFDWKQEANNCERKVTWTPMDSILYYKGFLQAGLVSVEPQTGFVKAWVGGANIDHFAYDHVGLGKRQVGSTMKPFVYAAAIEMGVVKPCTPIANIRHCMDLYNSRGRKDGRWCPQNADGGGGGGGTYQVSRGLQQSMNNITVGIMLRMGSQSAAPTVAKLLANMNINLPATSITPSMCLGTADMTLLEMTAAQATFANQGVYNKPTCILRIEDRQGNVIYSAKPDSKEALSANGAFATLEMMKKVVTGGTAGRLRQYVTHPTAGKTGTTQNNSDGWFIGLTPNLVTGVWVGAEDRSVRFRSTDLGQGARVSLPIYGMYLRELYKDPKVALSTEDFEPPESYKNSEWFNCSGGSSSSGESVTENNDPIDGF